MSDIAAGRRRRHRSPEAAPRTPPASQIGLQAWLRANLFTSWLNTAVTLVLAYFLIRWAIGFVDWGIVNAVWSVPNEPDPGLPRPARHRRLLGGDRREAPLHPVRHLPVRGALAPGARASLLFVGLYIVSAMRRFWRKELALVWIGGADRDRRADVGRRARPALRRRRSAGAGCRHHPDPGDLRPGLRLPAVDPAWRSAGGRSCRRSRRSACSTSS